MTAHVADATKKIYWHRELPPLAADMMGEHVLEAVSGRVPCGFSHRDALWDRSADAHLAVLKGTRQN